MIIYNYEKNKRLFIPVGITAPIGFYIENIFLPPDKRNILEEKYCEPGISGLALRINNANTLGGFSVITIVDEPGKVMPIKREEEVRKLFNNFIDVIIDKLTNGEDHTKTKVYVMKYEDKDPELIFKKEV